MNAMSIACGKATLRLANASMPCFRVKVRVVPPVKVCVVPGVKVFVLPAVKVCVVRVDVLVVAVVVELVDVVAVLVVTVLVELVIVVTVVVVVVIVTTATEGALKPVTDTEYELPAEDTALVTSEVRLSVDWLDMESAAF